MRRSCSHTELAFLSASQTVKGDNDLREEAIHLAAGMLMAGYGSVVGSMWSIRDDNGPVIADYFCRYLIEEARGDSGRAAYALHHAVAHLRDVRGENNFASWVPFVHLDICSSVSKLCNIWASMVSTRRSTQSALQLGHQEIVRNQMDPVNRLGTCRSRGN